MNEDFIPSGYGNWEMRMEDEIRHEDSIAIAAGNMCGMCQSVFHSSAECNRNVPCVDCKAVYVFLNYDQRCDPCHEKQVKDEAAYWAEQEKQEARNEEAGEPNHRRGDFRCTDCGEVRWFPHEGMFLDPNDEEASRCVDCHTLNYLRVEYQLDQQDQFQANES